MVKNRVHKSRCHKEGFIETILETMSFKGECILNLKNKNILLTQMYPDKNISNTLIFRKCRTTKTANFMLAKYDKWMIEAIYTHENE